MSRRGTKQRLSKHLRFGGDRQWSSGGLVGSVVFVNDTRGKQIIMGKLTHRGNGFYVDGMQIYLKQIREVMPDSRTIVCDTSYLLGQRQIPFQQTPTGQY